MGATEEGLADQQEEKEKEKEDPEPAIPRYDPRNKAEIPSGPSHPYNLRPRPKPPPRKSKRASEETSSKAQPVSREVLVEDALLVQRVVKADASLLPDRGQMMECHPPSPIGEQSVSQGHPSSNSLTKVHPADDIQEGAEAASELVTYL